MKKIVSILIVILIIGFIILHNEVKADSFRFEAVADVDEIERGNTVTISFSVNDIDVGDLGINVIEGNILYDSEVFEEITSKSIKGLNGWQISYNGEQNGKFLGIVTDKEARKLGVGGEVLAFVW